MNIIVSIVQQNLPYKVYMKTSRFFFMNKFSFKYLPMNMIVNTVQPTFRQKATFNYCDK